MPRWWVIVAGVLDDSARRGGDSLEPPQLDPEWSRAETSGDPVMRLSNGSEATADTMVEMLQFNEHFLDEDGAKFMLNPAELDDILGRDQYAADGTPIVVSAQHQQNHHNGHHHHHHHHHPNGVDVKPAANFADLKPLMPFHTITERVNINGIPGHHYQSIASNNRVAENNNNNNNAATNNNNMYYQNEYLVTSSTNVAGLTKFKEEDTFVDNQFDEFEMLMGSPSFGPDTTVTASGDHPAVDGPDEWLGVGDEWAAYDHPHGSPQDSKAGILNDVTIHDLVASSQFPGMTNTNGANVNVVRWHQPQQPSISQQQKQQLPYQQQSRELVTSNVPPAVPIPGAAAFMPLLQSRLQNGPANKAPLQDAGSYHMDCASSPSSSTPSYLAHSPTSHVVSTTDLGGGGYMPSSAAVHSSRPSPEFAHTTTPGQGAGGHMTAKKSRNRSGKSKNGGGNGNGAIGASGRSTVVYCSDGNVARERTVHNCHICNRGFLNKSNIKVHLRTHTGEKPFRCEVCQKAFRQKAHLIKHAQIHKRSGRD